MITVLENARVFDGVSAELVEGASVVVEGERIREIARRAPAFKDARVIDCAGRFLMPGLIDAHFHAYTPTFDIINTDRMPQSLLTCHATAILEGSLRRGFTTVRDAAGGDIGLWMAIESGLIKGPRFFFSGKAISQTGGHGDMRPGSTVEPCSCGRYTGSLALVADGVDEVTRAVREELRKGAKQIKLFLSGGVVSPTDPMWMPQFSEAEVRAAVRETATRRTYVMAHCHTDDAARRCVEYGVRSIEHGSQISATTAALIAASETFVVPTLSVVEVIREHGPRIGVPPMGLEKIKGLYEDMLGSIETCARAGVKMGMGSDLLGHEFHELQGGELQLRGQVNAPIDVLRSATSVNAELLQMDGQLGCIRPGAFADMLVLNGDPLKDLGLFREPLKHIPLVMKGGVCARNEL
ncbi:MAG: amidohydrolase family protein [Gammaproteobacteria bacterium]